MTNPQGYKLPGTMRLILLPVEVIQFLNDWRNGIAGISP
jgi:hypothetical protein